MVSISDMRKAGNLCLYYQNSTEFEEYLPKEKRWQKKKTEHLTIREKQILQLAAQGKKGEYIASSIGVAYESLRKSLSAIYRKLNVQSMIQSVVFSINHRMLFRTEKNNLVVENTTAAKKRKRTRCLITEAMFLRIQDRLDNGESVNSIAMREYIAESAIRYWIEKGKLIKKRILNN